MLSEVSHNSAILLHQSTHRDLKGKRCKHSTEAQSLQQILYQPVSDLLKSTPACSQGEEPKKRTVFWTQTVLSDIYPSLHTRCVHSKVPQLENQPCTKLPHSRQHPLTYFNIRVCTISSITVFASSSLSVKTLIEGEHWRKWLHLLVSCKAKYTHFEYIALVKQAQKSNPLTVHSLFEYFMSAHPIYCLHNISGKTNINLSCDEL